MTQINNSRFEFINSLMQQIPNFTTKRSGLKLKHHTNIPPICDCTKCPYYVMKTNKCMLNHCPAFEIRLIANAVPYYEMIQYDFQKINHSELVYRIKKIIHKGEQSMFFQNKKHKNNFYQSLNVLETYDKNIPSSIIAAVYLLSSDKELWNRAMNHVNSIHIHFKRINLKGFGTDGYILCKAAEDLIHKSKYITLQDLADSNIINDCILQLILSAIMIRRHGKHALK